MVNRKVARSQAGLRHPTPSRVEARIATGLHDVFHAADANNDGLLDRNEYSSARSAVNVRQ